MFSSRVRHLVLAAALAVAWIAPSEAAAVYKTRTNVDTNPQGAKAFLVTGQITELLGITPLQKVKLPRGPIVLRFELDGYEPLEKTIQIGRYTQSYVFELKKTVLPGVLDFLSGPEFAGAVVEVDGQRAGVVPIQVQVTPGRHQAVVTKEGFKRWERWIEVSENQRVTFDVVLQAETTPSGSLLVTSVPSGAQIRLNGSPRGTTPAVIEGLAPGQYLLELLSGDLQPHSQMVLVDSGQRATVEVVLQNTTVATGELKVLADLPETAISVDGTPFGQAPAVVPGLSAGSHVVEASAPGVPVERREVIVEGGKQTVVSFALAAAVAQTRSSVRVVCNVPGAMVSIDGSEPAPAPLERNDLPPGTHFVNVTARGWAEWSGSVNLEAGAGREVVAELQRAGRLEVRTKDEKPAEVFLDGKLLGKTPLIREDVPVGTYEIVVKAADGREDHKRIAVGTAEPANVTAFVPKPKRHRAMPWSAQTIDPTFGTLDLHTGWPFLLGVRFNAGVIPQLDLGVSVRSAFDVINEFEARGKWQIVRSKAFALAGELAMGGGVGDNERNTFFMKPTILGSMLMSERAAVTGRVGGAFFSDRTGPESIPAHKERKNRFQLLLGLTVEIRVHRYWNIFVLFEGDPTGANRRMYSVPWLTDVQMYGAAGASLLF